MEYLIGMMECISQWKHLAFKFSKQVGTTIVLGKMCAHYKFVIIIIIINNELHNKYHTIATDSFYYREHKDSYFVQDWEKKVNIIHVKV